MQWNETQYKTSLKNKLEDERECSHYSVEINLPNTKIFVFISDNILKEIELKKAISSHSFIQW